MNKDTLITEHYFKNHNNLLKKVINRVPNRSLALAEEVVQEAYARALKYFSTYNEKENFEKWFNAILRNATNDCRTAEGGNDKQYDDEDVVINNFSFYELNQFLRDINKYSERDRNVLRMFFMGGYTSKDISIYMGLSHTNTRQIIYRFKNNINEINDRRS